MDYRILNDIGTESQQATGLPFCIAGKNCVFMTASPADLLNSSESEFSTINFTSDNIQNQSNSCYQ